VRFEVFFFFFFLFPMMPHGVRRGLYELLPSSSIDGKPPLRFEVFSVVKIWDLFYGL
jgi:hypothetical protein